MFNFNRTECIMLEGGVRPLVDRILTNFNRIRARLSHEFEKQMADTAEGGSVPWEDWFRDGLRTKVLANMFYGLGMPVAPESAVQEAPLTAIYGVALYRASQIQPELRLFIASLIAGAEVTGTNFKDEREQKLRKIALVAVAAETEEPPANQK